MLSARSFLFTALLAAPMMSGCAAAPADTAQGSAALASSEASYISGPLTTEDGDLVELTAPVRVSRYFGMYFCGPSNGAGGYSLSLAWADGRPPSVGTHEAVTLGSNGIQVMVNTPRGDGATSTATVNVLKAESGLFEGTITNLQARFTQGVVTASSLSFRCEG